MAGQFCLWFQLPRKSQGSLTCCKSATWDDLHIPTYLYRTVNSRYGYNDFLYALTKGQHCDRKVSLLWVLGPCTGVYPWWMLKRKYLYSCYEQIQNHTIWPLRWLQLKCSEVLNPYERRKMNIRINKHKTKVHVQMHTHTHTHTHRDKDTMNIVTSNNIL
jgi:hypothetical protein